MGLFSIGEKNLSETNNYDQSTTIDQSVGAGGGSGSVNLGGGASYSVTSSDPAVTRAALEAMSTGNSAAIGAVQNLSTVQGWLQLFGLQTAVGAQGATASEALGRMERLAGNTTAAGLSLAGDVASAVLGNEGATIAANQQAVSDALLTAQSLGNNAQNLGNASLSAATNLGANAFGAATNLGAQSNATALGMSARNATLLENLGAGAFNLAARLGSDSRDLATAAFESSQATIQQVTDLADSSQVRMADLVTATQEYNTDLAKTTATGGATDILRTIMWIALAAVAAFAFRRR